MKTVRARMPTLCICDHCRTRVASSSSVLIVLVGPEVEAAWPKRMGEGEGQRPSPDHTAFGLAAIIHKFGVSVDFLRKFRAESVFRCDYKASKLVEPNRDEARAPSGNSSARRGLYICVGAGSQGTVRWDTDGASVMRRAFVRDKTMPGAPRCDEKFPEPGHRF